MTAPKIITDAVLEAVRHRFWSKVEQRGPDECWEWRAGQNRNGYGRIKAFGTYWTATRLALGLRGTIVPPDRLVCHRCDNPPCCNPKHLFIGTVSENTKDASDKGLLWRPSPHSHCREGHALDAANRLAGYARGCRICRNKRAREWRRAERRNRTVTALSPSGSSPSVSMAPPLQSTIAGES